MSLYTRNRAFVVAQEEHRYGTVWALRERKLGPYGTWLWPLVCWTPTRAEAEAAAIRLGELLKPEDMTNGRR